MKLYDETILSWHQLLKEQDDKKKELKVQATDWLDLGAGNMILSSDMAYELGGGTLPALGGLAVTDSKSFVPEDQILLYGKDLNQISRDTPFARLAIVRVNQDLMGEGNVLYNAIRKLEYTRYHLNPEGYMMRISALQQRECVRVGKDGLKKGLDFATVGNMFLQQFHENPRVEAVSLIFITDPKFPYALLEQQLQKAEQITKTIDHIMKNVTMDCGSCSLQEVCDEVEGMKEMHFQEMQKQQSEI